MNTNQNTNNLNQNNVGNNQNLSGTTPNVAVNQTQSVNTNTLKPQTPVMNQATTSNVQPVAVQSTQTNPAQVNKPTQQPLQQNVQNTPVTSPVNTPQTAQVVQPVPQSTTPQVTPTATTNQATSIGAAQAVTPQNVTPQVSQPTPQTNTQVVQPATVAQTSNTNQTPQVITPVQQQVTPQAVAQPVNEEIIINTTKKKTSNLIIIILVIIMIFFVFNIDTIINMINNYINNGTITNNTNTNTDNLSNGFILIDDTSYMSLEEIRFYNFKKKEDNIEITFNYEVNKKYDNAANLKIYIELYNSDKVLIYRELFDPKESLEKGTIRSYSLSLTNDIYTSAFYALAKIYTEKEENTTSKMVCKFNDNNENVSVNYEITYNFKNNGLTSYNVNKNYQLKGNSTTDSYVTEIENEYNSVKDIITSTTYENNTLQYTVDFSNNIEGFIPLYNKDAIINAIKEKETMKKWNCE